jgi:hypothetical protein
MKTIFNISIAVILSLTQMQSQCTHPDYAALMELYNSTGGDNWTNNTGWKEGAAGTNCNPCNGWHGVSCDVNNRVNSINLSYNGLTGILPALNNLPNLEYFDCYENNLTGDIPALKNLPKLGYFSCSNNKLDGVINNLEDLPNLGVFYCGYNQLTGSIPSLVGLPKLEIFHCNLNKLNGTISEISGTPSLREFRCEYNGLTGKVPELINCPKLEFFSCSENKLTGNLPQFDKLISIYFNSNNLSGCIPEIYKNYCSSNISYNLGDNPKLPFQGDLKKFCENGGISTGAPCNDGLATTIEDHILPDCSCLGAIADTCLVTIYDTLIVRDTITQFVTDTTFITITKEVAVTDTLIINLNLMNSTNQPVINTVLVYPNPASSHIYVDTGDPALLQNYDMEILNALGQPVYFTTIDQKIYYIDLNGWSGKGTYFIRIKNPNGTTIQTKKIILQ